MPTYANFIGPTYTTQSKVAADDRTVNWMPAKLEVESAAAPYVFDPAPGFSAFCTLPDAPGRGFYTLNGATVAVGGETLYLLPTQAGGSPTVLATGIESTGNSLVSIAGNGDGAHQVMVASNNTLYCVDLFTLAMTTITDVTGSFVVFQDGFFIALDPNTSTFYLSALEDGTSWDPLDAVQRNDTPDKWVAMIAVQAPKEIWLFGSQSTSVYYNSTDPDNPYIPNPNVAIAWGTAAPQSVALLYGSPIWLANDLTVRYARGYVPTRVSNHSLEYFIAQYNAQHGISNADAFVYTEQGHTCYVLNFPSADATWVFDVTTGMWHERGSWTGDRYTVLPVWTCTNAVGDINLVADRVSGAIYQMSQASAVDTDGVSGLRRLRRAPHLVSELKRVIYDRFQLYMEVGVGLTSGQGVDPQIVLSWSNDGGYTFGTIYPASVGALGQYRTRVIWRKLGIGRDRVFEVVTSDPVPYRLVGAFLDFRVGAS